MRKSSGAKRSGKVSESKKPDFKKNESGKSFSSENKPAPKFSRTDKPKQQVVKIKSDKDEIRLNKYNSIATVTSNIAIFISENRKEIITSAIIISEIDISHLLPDVPIAK